MTMFKGLFSLVTMKHIVQNGYDESHGQENVGVCVWYVDVIRKHA